MIKLISFFLIALILLLFGIASCSNSFNKENYLMCRPSLEHDRKKVRVKGGFSYKSTTFEECRSPAHYEL